VPCQKFTPTDCFFADFAQASMMFINGKNIFVKKSKFAYNFFWLLGEAKANG